jgi:hypothetical protein
MDGFCASSFMIDRAAGRVVGTAVFNDRASLEATRPDAQNLRERTASEMGAMIDHVDEMEAVFTHLHIPEMA